MNELVRELTHMGLSDKEAAVYLAAMELGPSVAQDIAKKAKVNRATTYVMIDSLKTRGLMSSFSKGKKKFFSAETPERLMSMVRHQRQELEDRESELSRILPQLMALFNVEGAKPQVRFLEGIEGLKTIQAELDALQGEGVQILAWDDAYEFIERVIEDHVKERMENFDKKQTRFRSIVAVKDEEQFAKIKYPESIKIRKVPFEQFPIHGEITIKEDKIAFFSYKSSLLAIVIVSQVLADTARAMFDLAWVGAEKKE
jgi:sugar-specific transcriptional regulator TrmB